MIRRLLPSKHARLAMVAAAFVMAAGPAFAQGTLRIGMTAADIPLTTGQTDQGGEGMRFMGYTVYDALINWDLSSADKPSVLVPGLALTAAVLLLATTPPPLRHPNLWLAALAVGLVAGSARGLMAPLQVDRLWDRLRLPAGRDGVWVGYALALVTLVVLSLDAAGIALSAWPDLAGNLLAATSAGFLGGRAGSLWLRSLSAPHDTWRTL